MPGPVPADTMSDQLDGKRNPTLDPKKGRREVANTVKTQPRVIALWNDRPVVVLLEEDGRETHYHGVMVGPEGMDYNRALRLLDGAAESAEAADPDSYGWDDIIERMKAAGFEEVRAAVWYE